MLAAELAAKIRQEVFDTLKYTCSAGISYNKMLAKLASGLNKPNQQTIITPRYCISSLRPIEIKKVRNFGGKISTALKERGIETLGKLQELNLRDLAAIVKDEDVAKWIFFRCRGFDDEAVEAKKTENKTILSHKSFSSIFDMKKLMGMVELVIADLNSRLTAFYEETGYVPQTLTLQYFDRTSKLQKSKSSPINLFVPKPQFKLVILSKCTELIKSVEKVLFPCTLISITARNFCKSDLQNYKCDLATFFKKKESASAGAATAENSNSLHGALSYKSDMSTSMNAIGPSHNDLRMEEEKREPTTELPEDQELTFIKCEKCDETIPSNEIESHRDFHLAEELDREINPHKRKYNSKRNFTEFETENSQLCKDSNTQNPKDVESGPNTKMMKSSVGKGSIKPGTNESRFKIKPIDSYFKRG